MAKKKKKSNAGVLLGAFFIVAFAVLAVLVLMIQLKNIESKNNPTDDPGTISNQTPEENANTNTPELTVVLTPTPAPTATQGPTAAPTPTPTPTPVAPPYSTTVLDKYEIYDSDTIKRDILKLADTYSEILTAKNIGKTVNGKDIYALFMGSGSKKILITGGIHARENITVNYVMRIAEDYARAYCRRTNYFEYDIYNLLKKATICFVPCVNPDGLDIVNKGLQPNLDKQYSAYDLATWKANANGVDLNRNFPFMWEQMSSQTGVNSPGKMNYPGPSAASEPETKAIIDLVAEYKFTLNLNFHTKGKIMYWRDTANGVIQDDEMWADVIMHSLGGYTKAPATSSLESYGGGLENWFRSYTGRNAYCIELTDGNDGEIPYNNAKLRQEYGLVSYEYYSQNVLDWTKTREILIYILYNI